MSKAPTLPYRQPAEVFPDMTPEEIADAMPLPDRLVGDTKKSGMEDKTANVEEEHLSEDGVDAKEPERVKEEKAMKLDDALTKKKIEEQVIIEDTVSEDEKTQSNPEEQATIEPKEVKIEPKEVKIEPKEVKIEPKEVKIEPKEGQTKEGQTKEEQTKIEDPIHPVLVHAVGKMYEETETNKKRESGIKRDNQELKEKMNETNEKINETKEKIKETNFKIQVQERIEDSVSSEDEDAKPQKKEPLKRRKTGSACVVQSSKTNK